MPSLSAEPESETPLLTHAASERHFDYGAVVRDITIGFTDGITVPFALTAGLSSLGSSKIVIVGGLAELFSGAISMGLGAYLAAVTDRDHYKSEEAREREEVLTKPEAEKEECFEILGEYGISREASQSAIESLVQDTEQWIRFMMDFELKLGKPNFSRAWISAATMGMSYLVGGLIPLTPYFATKNTTNALFVSIAITIFVCFAFGFFKYYAILKTKRAGLYGALQTLLMGALAAGTSYGIVYGVDHSNIAVLNNFCGDR